ncbi:MAG: LysR family transcriptional regulator, partial [Yaniella sp.]|uniref:helix-turn-helix domain-containing protein n=1 Tax=Yaniella sp. TaxID=2773929 RepID=UPI0026479AED
MTPNAPRHEFWLSLPMLRLLVGIADHGSLSASARSAGIAQSNATRSLQTLERRLGYSLIHRSTQVSTLTEH